MVEMDFSIKSTYVSLDTTLEEHATIARGAPPTPDTWVLLSLGNNIEMRHHVLQHGSKVTFRDLLSKMADGDLLTHLKKLDIYCYEEHNSVEAKRRNDHDEKLTTSRTVSQQTTKKTSQI
eukprot:GHVT01069796.1.p1 GENE.GHVT01069796.1~~GHVT01069796.1.p1  ORF type:complete len:120 (-),score=10.52 GHVT01069796.1:2269-2628(-)